MTMKTIGEFYKARILSLPKNQVTKREISYSFLEKMRIEKDLFNWKIYYTKLARKSEEFLECRSEEEARYLKALIDSGLTKILVPKDDEYLKSIVPELESIKARIDEILNGYMQTLVSRKLREQLKYQVFAEITK